MSQTPTAAEIQRLLTVTPVPPWIETIEAIESIAPGDLDGADTWALLRALAIANEAPDEHLRYSLLWVLGRLIEGARYRWDAALDSKEATDAITKLTRLMNERTGGGS